MIEGSALSSIIFIALEVNFLHLRASLHLWSIITFVASTHSLQSFYFLGSIFSKVVFCDSWDPSTRCHLYTTHCLGSLFPIQIYTSVSLFVLTNCWTMLREEGCHLELLIQVLFIYWVKACKPVTALVSSTGRKGRAKRFLTRRCMLHLTLFD